MIYFTFFHMHRTFYMIDTSHPVLGGMAVRSHYHKQEEQRMQP